jgi:hypothetical protein
VVDLAAEQGVEDVHRPLGLGDQPLQSREPALMPGDQVVEPGVQAAEWIVVRRQHQHVVRHPRLDPRQRGQPVGQGVTIRFGREHGDVGRDPRQHLVAGNHQLQVGAVEADVLGAVARAHHHLPDVVADRYAVAVAHPVEAVRQGVQSPPEAAEAGAVGLDGLLVPAGRAIELECVRRRLAAGVGGQ